MLEHYRYAVYELTRQNLLLKRQLANAEESLQKHVDSGAESNSTADTTVASAPHKESSFGPDDGKSPTAHSLHSVKAESPSAGAPRKSAAFKPRFWSRTEHSKFLEGLKMFGSHDAHSIAAHVGTRTVIQVRTHAQKYFLKLEKSGAPAAGKGEGGSKGKDAEGTKATNSSDSGDEADDGGDDF